MPTEFVIPDLVTASLEIEFYTASGVGTNHVLHYSALSTALRAACLLPADKLIFFNGRAHHPVYASSNGLASGCFWAGSDGDGGAGEVILAPVGQENARIRVGVKLARAQDGTKAWLEVETNPTTLTLGSNIHPAAFSDPLSQKDVANPSSNWAAMTRAYRLGFDFLEQITERRLFDEATRFKIESGNFHLVRVQWAATKQVNDVKRVLQLLTVVYDQTIARGTGIINNASHLGLEFQPYFDGAGPGLTGVQFQKRHGKKLIFSTSVYDKRARLMQMQQPLEQLDEAQAITVKQCARFDITAHSEGIIVIAKKAQKKLKEWGRKGLKFFDFISPDIFLRDEPKASLWWLQRSVFLLSHFYRRGKFQRFSFGTWLVPYVETDVLHFDVIAGITSRGFHTALGLRDPIALAWRSDKVATRDGWAERFAKAAKCSPATVYSRRDHWKTTLGIDIAFPLQLYADVLHMGQASTAKPESIVKMLIAAKIQDGDALARLYSEALADFEEKRITILIPFLLSRPRQMRLERPKDTAERDVDVDDKDLLSVLDNAILLAAPTAQPAAKLNPAKKRIPLRRPQRPRLPTLGPR